LQNKPRYLASIFHCSYHSSDWRWSSILPQFTVQHMHSFIYSEQPIQSFCWYPNRSISWLNYRLIPSWYSYTTAAAASLAVSARTSDFQTLHHGVLLSAWYRPWILLGGLPAHIRDLSSPATAFGLQCRRCGGSCHMPVFTWRPRIPGHKSSSVECATAQCHLRTISFLILVTPEVISIPATTASITRGPEVLALSITLILANWIEQHEWVLYHCCLPGMAGQARCGTFAVCTITHASCILLPLRPIRE